MPIADLWYGSERQRRHRLKRDRTWLQDIFWYSSVYEYRLVRVLIHLPVGFLVSLFIYTRVLAKLDVGAWDIRLEMIYGWTLVIMIALIYAWNPILRTTMLLAVTMVGAKQGHKILMLQLFANIASDDGPIENTLHNFGVAANSITCYMTVAKDIAVYRARLALDPIQRLIRTLVTGTHEARETVNVLENVYAPLVADVNDSGELNLIEEDRKRSEELRKLYNEMTPSRNDEKRRKSQAKSDESKLNDKPFYENYTSPTARFYAKKIQFRCDTIFVESALACNDNMEDLKTSCYENIHWSISWFVCKSFDVANFCNGLFNSEETRKKVCDSKKVQNDLLPKDFDSLMSRVENVGSRLSKELLISIHYVAFEAPRIIHIHDLLNINLRISLRLEWLRALLNIVKSILQGLFVIFVYKCLNGAFTVLRQYLNNINWNNHYVSPYFMKIDERRKKRGIQSLLPLRKTVKKEFNIVKWNGWPSKPEIETFKSAFWRWLLILLVVHVFIIHDVILYNAIMTLHDIAGTQKVNIAGKEMEKLEVRGSSFVADIVRKLVHEYNHAIVVNKTFDTAHCKMKPRAPDWNAYFQLIYLPLLFMLLLQVIFSYIFFRIRLFCVLNYIFRHQYKARALHLYHKLLQFVADSDKNTRAKLRYEYQKHRYDKISSQFSDEVFKNPIVSQLRYILVVLRLLKTHCVLCNEKIAVAKAILCKQIHCSLPYCEQCWSDINERCYACAVVTGEVNSSDTMPRPRSPSPIKSE